MGYVLDIDHGWKKIKSEILQMDKKAARIGVFGKSGHVLMYASANEYGTTINHPGGTPFFILDGEFIPLPKRFIGKAALTKPHTITIPSRPFMRNAFDNHRSEISAFILSMKNDIFSGKRTADDALELIGLDHKTRVQEEINGGNFVANAAGTIAKKGKGKKPLTDSGVLSSSITYEIAKI